MKTPIVSVRLTFLTLALAVILPMSTHAIAQQALAQQQQPPLTGRMMDGQTSTAAAQSSAPAPSVEQPAPATYYAAKFGDTTRYLVQLQADGSQAGKPLPMLGAEAHASYQRYLKSFEHPIPDFYDSNVGKDANNGGR